MEEGFDFAAAGDDFQPGFGDGVEAVGHAGECAGDAAAGVGVVAEVDGVEHGVFVAGGVE